MTIEPDTAPLADPTTDAMPRRPLAAWLLIVAMALVTVALLLGAARLVSSIATHAEASGDSAVLVVAIGWRLGLAAALSFAIVRVFQRRPIGRWLGVAALVLLAAWNLLRPDDGQLPNDAQRGGAMLARVVVFPLLCAGWAYAFAWSKKAKRYFARS